MIPFYGLRASNVCIIIIKAKHGHTLIPEHDHIATDSPSVLVDDSNISAFAHSTRSVCRLFSLLLAACPSETPQPASGQPSSLCRQKERGGVVFHYLDQDLSNDCVDPSGD